MTRPSRTTGGRSRSNPPGCPSVSVQSPSRRSLAYRASRYRGRLRYGVYGLPNAVEIQTGLPTVPAHPLELLTKSTGDTATGTAAAAAIDLPSSAFYTDPRGMPELRRTIAAKLAADNGIVADSESEIVVTIGAKQALFITLLALVDPGDEVLLEDPGYLGFEPLVRLAGATPVPVPLRPEDGFR